MPVEPLLRWRPAHATVALGLLGGVFGALVVGYLWLVWLFSPVDYPRE